MQKGAETGRSPTVLMERGVPLPVFVHKLECPYIFYCEASLARPRMFFQGRNGPLIFFNEAGSCLIVHMS